jgi:hypothetical protein
MKIATEPTQPATGAAARMIISGRARPGARLNGMLSKRHAVNSLKSCRVGRGGVSIPGGA